MGLNFQLQIAIHDKKLYSLKAAKKLKKGYSTSLEVRQTQTQSGVLAALVCMVINIYPIIILNVDISYLGN